MSPAQDLEEQIASLIAKSCNLERSAIASTTSIMDLGVDSLTLISVSSHVCLMHGAELTTSDTAALMQAVCISDVVAITRRVIDQYPRSGARGSI